MRHKTAKQTDMRRLVYAIVLAIVFASVSFAQGGPLRTGFAVVTPITGGRSAFSVTETFTEQFGGNILRSSVQSSPLVTLTSMVIFTDPASAANTGIAIVDPFDTPATVTL